jgi:hypothetical protein
MVRPLVGIKPLQNVIYRTNGTQFLNKKFKKASPMTVPSSHDTNYTSKSFSRDLFTGGGPLPSPCDPTKGTND